MQRSEDGKTYYQFEFLAKASNFTRHGLGTVAIKDGVHIFFPFLIPDSYLFCRPRIWKGFPHLLLEYELNKAVDI